MMAWKKRLHKIDKDHSPKKVETATDQIGEHVIRDDDVETGVRGGFNEYLSPLYNAKYGIIKSMYE